VDVNDLIQIIEDERDTFQREEDQGLLQHDLHKAEQALAGKYACERILRRIEPRVGRHLINVRTMSRAR
jgi:hypothetical protein